MWFCRQCSKITLKLYLQTLKASLSKPILTLCLFWVYGDECHCDCVKLRQ